MWCHRRVHMPCAPQLVCWCGLDCASRCLLYVGTTLLLLACVAAGDMQRWLLGSSAQCASLPALEHGVASISTRLARPEPPVYALVHGTFPPPTQQTCYFNMCHQPSNNCVPVCVLHGLLCLHIRAHTHWCCCSSVQCIASVVWQPSTITLYNQSIHCWCAHNVTRTKHQVMTTYHPSRMIMPACMTSCSRALPSAYLHSCVLHVLQGGHVRVECSPRVHLDTYATRAHASLPCLLESPKHTAHTTNSSRGYPSPAHILACMLGCDDATTRPHMHYHTGGSVLCTSTGHKWK